MPKANLQLKSILTRRVWREDLAQFKCPSDAPTNASLNKANIPCATRFGLSRTLLQSPFRSAGTESHSEDQFHSRSVAKKRRREYLGGRTNVQGAKKKLRKIIMPPLISLHPRNETDTVAISWTGRSIKDCTLSECSTEKYAFIS